VRRGAGASRSSSPPKTQKRPPLLTVSWQFDEYGLFEFRPCGTSPGFDSRHSDEDVEEGWSGFWSGLLPFQDMTTAYAIKLPCRNHAISVDVVGCRPVTGSFCHAEGRGFESHHPLSTKPR
jgi:hypothetical protein